MSIFHTNRRGKTYYLHVGTTRKGNPKYYFAMNQDGDLVDEIPDGYEIYENPNGQVYLRKVKPALITNAEKAIVDEAMRENPTVQRYIIDIKGKVISIHIPNQDVGALEGLFRNLSTAGRISEVLDNVISNSPMMRFELIDDEKRLFVVSRYGYRGTIDDWMPI